MHSAENLFHNFEAAMKRTRLALLLVLAVLLPVSMGWASPPKVAATELKDCGPSWTDCNWFTSNKKSAKLYYLPCDPALNKIPNWRLQGYRSKRLLLHDHPGRTLHAKTCPSGPPPTGTPTHPVPRWAVAV